MVALEIDVYAGESGPPYGVHLAAGRYTSDDPLGGDQPVDLSVVLPTIGVVLTLDVSGAPSAPTQLRVCGPDGLAAANGDLGTDSHPRNLSRLKDHSDSEMDCRIRPVFDNCLGEISG
jgi:hypothetical protein